jgi:crotonobetainyl-CoA:carnitine CoA-transferase CaiB-like acyl-CoA transferase
VVTPLSGLTVAEVVTPGAPEALALAVGLAGRIAADLGARVLHLSDTAVPSDSHAFLDPGKETVTARGRAFGEAVHDLTGRADAILCDHAALPLVEPQGAGRVLVSVAMSHARPDAGTEFLVEAQSGLLDLVGDPDRQPLRLGGHQMAHSAGLAAYLALVAGLAARRNGETVAPARIDLLDVAVWLNWKTLGLAARGVAAPRRAGRLGEWPMLACADGYIAMVFRNQEWPSLKRATGDARLEDERFASPALRRRNRAALNAILADIFGRMTRAEIRRLALAHKLPLGPVWAPGELVSDPHMTARGAFVAGAAGTIPRLPVTWNDVVPAVAGVAGPLERAS